ncbi:MAG TPA: sigma-54 dependent transcriptional regulator [Myxococcota bacterium]|nr:sigma-54 dependent transcriptional regulator [Myxococcota bacterium]HRY95121.1 sigma-54 dependent transcriptional regulator [Myxococcota bacterium]HSA23053.1 sigma-54 dependent transcriptional regulator [Myxococcota bacterium]
MGTATRILVVDDEESVRHQIAALLKLKGFQVEAVGDGPAALALLEERPCDLVLCDVRMPGMDGLSVLDKLGGTEADEAVIIMSAYGDLELAREAVRRGAADYLNKPYKNEELLLRISIVEARQQLRRENRQLRQQIRRESGFERIVGQAAVMQRMFRTVEKIAEFKSTVLILGESGTGKELLARAVHDHSPRKDKPFVAVNCGAIPENLLESELFGHTRGAFTDAIRNKEGLFEEADGGTLFLDEIGELPLGLQVKLLRVLQEDEIRRVGENRPRKVDVRILAATIRDLGAEVAAGRFREDLFYRLNVLMVKIPALRERPEDIPVLVEHFLQRCNAKLHTAVRGVEPAAMKLLVDYAWPGNVRELENLIERAVILCEGEVITPELLTDRVRAALPSAAAVLPPGQISIKKTVRAIEEELIRRALAETHGNRTRAARLLEISHRTLLYKLKDYHIEADAFAQGVPTGE